MNLRIRFACAALCGLAAAFLAGQPSGAAEEVLTNETIVKMCSLGLSQDVVIAKINQAEAVAFRLDSGSLLALKDQGVPQPVIVAMLNRAARGQATPPPPPPEPLPEPPPAGKPERAAPAAEQPAASVPAPTPAPAVPAGPARPTTRPVSVRIMERGPGERGTAAGEIAPGRVAGTSASEFVPFRRVNYLHFPGLAAEARIASGRPELLLRDDASPEGRFTLVALEPDRDKQRRALRMAPAGPHADWTVACDVSEVSPGEWRLDPRRILGPGEYGLLGPGAELLDFGVDEPASGEPVVSGTEKVEFAKTMLLDLSLPLDPAGESKGGRSGVDLTGLVERYRCDRVSFSRLSVEERHDRDGQVEYRIRGRLVKPRREELLLKAGADLVCGGRRVASSPPRQLQFEEEMASDVPWSTILERPEANAGEGTACLIRLRVEVTES